MTQTGTSPAVLRTATRPTDAAPAVAEPATPRALWPTFMRRTLAEDALRQASPPPAE